MTQRHGQAVWCKKLKPIRQQFLIPNEADFYVSDHLCARQFAY
jgi:hypothetical protein